MDHRPLHIIVVGAGLGGLAAAVALRRRGHHVEVFESSGFFNEVGAGIGLPPNAVRILESLSCDQKNLKCVEYAGIRTLGFDGTAGLTQNLNDIQKTYGKPWYLTHRVDLHNELRRLATSEEGSGPPTKIHINSAVESCDINNCSVILTDQKTHSADLILGADGIHSIIRANLLGPDMSPPPSGIAAFRWMMDAEQINQHPELDWILKEGPSGPRAITTRDSRVVFLYPCRNKTLINILAIHSDQRDQSNVDWNSAASKDNLMKVFGDFHPKFRNIFLLAQDIRVWQLRSITSLPSWSKGRVCLLGDAAHAVFPTLGQGFAMALEDAVTLSNLLPIGTTLDEIPDRLDAYELLRRSRVEFVATQSLSQIVEPAKRGLYYRSPEMRTRIMGHDAEEQAKWFYTTHISKRESLQDSIQ